MPVVLTLQVALVTAAGGLLAGLGATWIALATFEVDAALVFRALVVLTVLLVAPYLLVRRRVLSATRRGLVLAGAVGLTAGFALNPFGWTGHGFFAQLIVGPGPVTALFDLAAWLVVGSVAVVLASRSASGQLEPLGYRV